jgi:hypothetical protein
MKQKVIGNYIRKGINPKAPPKYLKKDNERYLMERQRGGYYETMRPPETVPKIGVKRPNKIKYTLKELLDIGYYPVSRDVLK